MVTMSFFSARPEMKYQQPAIKKLFTLINQNRSQILIIYYVDKQSWIIPSNMLIYIHVL